jgi:hypothetical protein
MEASTFRRCLNIKSQKNPDVQCPYSAASGDYCLRHCKNPKPFSEVVKQTPLSLDAMPSPSKLSQKAAKLIQKRWRLFIPLHRFSSQGPAANALDLAVNETELYSMDPATAIPPVYRFSFSDERKSIWLFDIRTLAHSMATGFAQKNPYTRDPLSKAALDKLYKRIEWLRIRKYQIRHAKSDILTEEQVWNQKVLDVFLKIEALGYYVSCDWFHQMTLGDHKRFYSWLYSLWEWRLTLTHAQKEQIVPGYLMASSRLFRYPAHEMEYKERGWWQKLNLSIISAMTTRAVEVESRKLGALYVIMALTRVLNVVAESFPWISDI